MESQRSREHSFNTPAAAKLNSVKLFVGGLSGDITHDVILTYFRQFGEILEAVVIYEKRKPSGFGFINVGDQKVADLILSQKHQIGKSRLDVKPAIDRSSAKIQGLDERKKKVFVGGLPKNFTDDELQAYFVKFGSVQRCYVAKNPITGKTRGFGFVVFDHAASATKVLEITDHIIGGQQVHLKFATDKAERDKEAPHEDHQDQLEPQEKQKKKDKKKPKDEHTPDDVGKSRNELAVLNQDTRTEQTSKSNPKSSEVSGGQSGSHGHKSKREKPIIKKLTLKDPKIDTDKAAKIPVANAVIEAPVDHAHLEVGEEPRLRPLGNIKSSTNSRSFMSKPSNDSFLDTPTSQQLRSHGFPSKDGSLRDRNSVHAASGIGPPLRQQEGFDYPQNQRRIAIQKSGSFQNSTAPSLHDQDRYPGIHAPAYQSPGMLEPNQYYHHEMGSTPQHPGHSFQYGYEQTNPNPNYHQGKYFAGHSFNQNRQPIPNHCHRGGRSTRHPYGSNHAMNNRPQWPEAQNNPEIWNPANQMGYGYPQQSQPDAYPVYVDVPPSYEGYDYGYNPPYASFPQDLNAYPEDQVSEPYTSDYYNPNMLGMAAQGMYQFAGYKQEPLVHKTETELSQAPASTSEPSQGNPSSNEMQNSGVHTGNGELGQQTQHPSFDSGEHAQKKKPDDGFYIHLASAGMPAPSSTDQPQGFGQRASAAMSQLANKPAPNSLNSTPTKGARPGVYMKSASKEFHRAQSKENSQFVIYEHPHEENNPESNLLGAIEEVVDPAQEKALESAQRVIDAGTPLSN